MNKVVKSDFEEITKKIDTTKYASYDVLRLAIPCYMLNINYQIILIFKEIGDNNVQLRTVVDLFILSSVFSIDYKNLDQSMDIDQIEALLEGRT